MIRQKKNFLEHILETGLKPSCLGIDFLLLSSPILPQPLRRFDVFRRAKRTFYIRHSTLSIFLQLSARAATLESQLNSYIVQKSELEVKLESEGRRLRILEEQRAKEVAVLEALKKSFAEEISELKKEKVFKIIIYFSPSLSSLFLYHVQ